MLQQYAAVRKRKLFTESPLLSPLKKELLGCRHRGNHPMNLNAVDLGPQGGLDPGVDI